MKLFKILILIIATVTTTSCLLVLGLMLLSIGDTPEGLGMLLGYAIISGVCVERIAINTKELFDGKH